MAQCLISMTNVNVGTQILAKYQSIIRKHNTFVLELPVPKANFTERAYVSVLSPKMAISGTWSSN